MTRIRAVLALSLAGLTVLLLALVGPAGAGVSAAGADRFEVAGDGSIGSVVFTPLGVSGAETTVVVQLVAEPVAVVEANSGRKLSKEEKNAIKNQLKGTQDGLSAAIVALGGQILGSYQFAYNGIKVKIKPAKTADLEKLPGVVAVRPLQKMERTNIRGLPLIGAPGVWNGDAGFRGEGIKIAVIDTGVDYTHANFGGPGTIAAYNAANAADTAPADPALFGPAAPRVKGGTDLVGDAYNASGTGDALVPKPDPNPLDCNGHGSHVTGTAAGSGVLGDGSTYAGPYNPTTISSNDWRIGPGVAPKADIYAVRVFGCAGSTDVTVDAIEWSVENEMDVINMSLGSPFGTNNDPSAVASTNAAKAGVIVVASAGNSGPNQYITGSPAAADGAISVAANDPWPTTPGVRVVTAPPTGTPLNLSAINANGHEYTGPVMGPVVILQDNPATTVDEPGLIGSANEAQGCSPASYAFNGIAAGLSQIAVAIRGTCARVAKAIFAQMAGAAVAVMTNNAAGLPPFEGRITSNPDTGIPFDVTIPFVGIAGNQATAGTDSFRLRASPAGTTATLTEIDLVNTNFTGFASFTSGGGRTGDSALKPDVTAPGVSIQSTANGTGNGAAIISGTSMSAPHTAGAAALVAQAHPDWTPAEVKAAMVNTGNPGGVLVNRISRGGTGLVQPANAIATQVVAAANGGSKFDVAVSFGVEELKGNFSKTKPIKLRNFGSTPATFNVAQGSPAGSVHSVGFNTSSVTVPAGGSADVELTLNVTATTAGRANGAGLSYQEVAGFATFTPASAADNNGVMLRVPYLLVPRAQADVATKVDGSLAPGETSTARITNKADAPVSGDADFYAWGLEDKKDKGKVSNDVRAIGVQSFPFPSATVPSRRLLVFAVNVWDSWSNAATNEFDIFVDVNNDGVDDYVVVGVDFGAVTAGSFNGQIGAFVFSTRSPGAAINFFGAAPTDGSTMLLPVLTTAMCRTGEPCLNSATVPGMRIAYHAFGFDLANGGVDVVDGTANYNPWNEAITTGGFRSVAPGGSATESITINSAEWALTPAMGLMVVTFDNKNGKDEAQLIEAKKK